MSVSASISFTPANEFVLAMIIAPSDALQTKNACPFSLFPQDTQAFRTLHHERGLLGEQRLTCLPDLVNNSRGRGRSTVMKGWAISS